MNTGTEKIRYSDVAKKGAATQGDNKGTTTTTEHLSQSNTHENISSTKSDLKSNDSEVKDKETPTTAWLSQHPSGSEAKSSCIADKQQFSSSKPSKESSKVDSIVSPLKTTTERELKSWQPDTEINYKTIDHDMTTPVTWNQFEVNEKLFGLQTDFHEDFYTTKLDKDSPDYKKREREAEKIAREINKQYSNNPHMKEERGHIVEEVDEETKYGAVIRGPNTYIPPSLRKKYEDVMTHPSETTTSKDGTAAVLDGSQPPPLPPSTTTTTTAAVGAEQTPVSVGIKGLDLSDEKTPSSSTKETTSIEKDSRLEGEKKSFKLNPNAPEFKPLGIFIPLLNPITATTMPYPPYIAPTGFPSYPPILNPMYPPPLYNQAPYSSSNQSYLYPQFPPQPNTIKPGHQIPPSYPSSIPNRPYNTATNAPVPPMRHPHSHPPHIQYPTGSTNGSTFPSHGQKRPSEQAPRPF